MLFASGGAALDNTGRYLDVLLCEACANVLREKVAAHNFGEVVNKVLAGEPGVVARVIGGGVGVRCRHDADQHTHGRGIVGRRFLPRTQLDNADKADKGREQEGNPPSAFEDFPVLAKFHACYSAAPLRCSFN